MWDRFAWILRRAGEGEGFGAVEASARADFAPLVRVDLLFEDRPSEDGSSDTPQGMSGSGGGLTPRRVALDAAPAFAEGFLEPAWWRC